jgi:hypothetical protein
VLRIPIGGALTLLSISSRVAACQSNA